MQIAPLYTQIAEAPKNGEAYWIHAEDGVRLRVGLWQSTSPPKGTVLVFPGRTEYIEKYGHTVSDLQKLGFTTFVIDWRGQGLADRIAEDPLVGHVVDFTDYQKDVVAMLKAAKELDLPKPWHLVAHSMGACIGLRAAIGGLPVSSCVFTGPMWKINLPAIKRAAAWILSWAAQVHGKGHIYAPGTDGKSYVLNTPLEDNRLTNDPKMYQYFTNQAMTLMDHQIGGPSMSWLFQTLKETRALSRMQSPKIPCIVLCGEQDEVIDIIAVQDRITCWHNGKLEMIQNAKHDLLSETPPTREKVLTAILELSAK